MVPSGRTNAGSGWLCARFPDRSWRSEVKPSGEDPRSALGQIPLEPRKNSASLLAGRHTGLVLEERPPPNRNGKRRTTLRRPFFRTDSPSAPPLRPRGTVRLVNWAAVCLRAKPFVETFHRTVTWHLPGLPFCSDSSLQLKEDLDPTVGAWSGI